MARGSWKRGSRNSREAHRSFLLMITRSLTGFEFKQDVRYVRNYRAIRRMLWIYVHKVNVLETSHGQIDLRSTIRRRP